MSPLISSATDNLGLIFSLQLGAGGGGGPVPVEDFFYNIELFGEGFANSLVSNDSRYGPGDGFTSPSQSLVINNGGGYTKLRMKSLTSSDISFEPQLYLGGRCITSLSFFSSTTFADDGVSETSSGTNAVDRKAAGDAAAFSIDGEWMGIAGGGSQSYYVRDESTRGDGNSNNTLFSSEITNLVPASGLPQDGGQGGVNFFNPSAVPQNGQNLTNPIIENSFEAQTFARGQTGFNGTRTSDTNVGGAGGAGAGPGVSRDSTTLTPSTGGAGNIRIWADTAGVDGIAAGQFSGDISSVPGTTMQLEFERDGQEIGSSRVAITATNTGLGITYTDNTTLSLRELKALLDPELEFAFDIELYGEGIGQDNTITSVTNQVNGVPSPTVVSNNSGKGGYTKLRMIVPSSASQISFEPNKYAGGISTTTRTTFTPAPVQDSFEFGKGGDAAAFSIDGEWMGVAGGSGQVYYRVENETIIGTNTTVTETSTIISTPSIFGSGGVNELFPTASPEGGQGKLNEGNFNQTGTVQEGTDYRGGSGGGGAGRGSAYVGDLDGPATISPSGGEGNIRVYEQTNGASENGDIFLPGIDPIYMRLEDSRDNFWDGASKVVVSHPITGVSLEYTSDTTISIRELRALLIPTQELVFDIELFGGGAGVSQYVNGSYITGIDRDGFFAIFFDDRVFTDVNNLSGGYTKLKMFVPISDAGTISFEPEVYLGGAPSLGSAPGGGRGQSAAAFSINGEWMAIAGGGGSARITQDDINSVTRDAEGFITNSSTRFIQSGFSATVPGKGGVNQGNPTASPENGGNYTYTLTTTSNTGSTFFRGSSGGGGGGGALGGIGRGINLAAPGLSGSGDGGEGNIRIYAETNGAETKGDLTSVPGVYMELLNSADDFWVGRSTVKLNNLATGGTFDYRITNRTFTVKELREILYPGVFPPA